MHSTINVDDNYLGSGVAILQAIQIYGKSNFIREILCFCDTLKEANDNEIKYINEYNTLAPNGYNISPTGGVSFLAGHHSAETKLKLAKVQIGRKHTEEHRRKNSEANKGKIPWMKGKHHSEETIKKIKETLKGRDTSPCTEETRKKISQTLKGNIPWNKGRKGMGRSKEKITPIEINNII